MEWIKPYLVQVLNKPYPTDSKLFEFGNPFCFGGGLVNGGLTKEANDCIKQIWSWEYMGAAEYEFGEVPKTLRRMVDGLMAGDYVAGYFAIKGKYRPLNKDGRPQYEWDKVEAKPCTTKTFVFCHKDHVVQVKEFLTDLAHGRENKKRLTRDDTRSNVVFHPNWQDIKDVFPAIGGLNFENAFVYLTYQPSIDKFCEIFSLKMD